MLSSIQPLNWVCQLRMHQNIVLQLQSTLIISKIKGHSEILRDIWTSTYQICNNEEKNNRIIHIPQWIYNLTPEVRDIEKYCEKGEELLLGNSCLKTLSLSFFFRCEVKHCFCYFNNVNNCLAVRSWPCLNNVIGTGRVYIRLDQFDILIFMSKTVLIPPELVNHQINCHILKLFAHRNNRITVF